MGRKRFVVLQVAPRGEQYEFGMTGSAAFLQASS